MKLSGKAQTNLFYKRKAKMLVVPSKNGYEEMVSFLLENITAASEEDLQTALNAAKEKSHQVIVRMLREKRNS